MTGRKPSILRRITIPFLIVMLIQAVLVYGIAIFGGVIGQLKVNALDILNKNVEGRNDNLENEMLQRWSNVGETAEKVVMETQAIIDKYECTAKQLTYNSKISEELLLDISNSMVYMLRKNSVTGAFVIFNGDSVISQPTQNAKKAGMIVRDSNPESNPGDYSDLSMLRAPSSVTKATNIALDSMWEPYFTLNPDANNTDYFYKPLIASAQNRGLSYKDAGYWSMPFYLNDNNYNEINKVMTYSVPLIDSEGMPFGVIGVEIDIDYMAKKFNSSEISSNNTGGYAVAVRKGDKIIPNEFSFNLVMTSNEAVNAAICNDQKSIFAKYSEPSIYQCRSSAECNGSIFASVHSLELYNTHTPFENERWMLMGVESRESLFEFSYSVMENMITTLLFSFVIGIFIALITAKYTAIPIVSLAKQLESLNTTKAISLSRVNIKEVDYLAEAIEELNNKVVESSNRTSKILEMTDTMVGAFEYEVKTNKVYCTNKVFELLGVEKNSANEIDPNALEKYFRSLVLTEQVVDSVHDRKIFLADKGIKPRWIRLDLVINNGQVLGVITDVTHDMLEKKKLEYERDYDLITNILNRRAFLNRYQKLFENTKKLRIAALFMLDLDNLKFINDTYGHDCGDEYIRLAGNALRKYAGSNSLVARISGDEFLAFIYNYSSKDEIREVLKNIEEGLKLTKLMLPNGTDMSIRGSAGISWYPDSSENCDQLIRYADFAMYMVKKTNKGKFKEFNLETYNRNSYLLHCTEELNEIIEKGLVGYQFQPIVNARNGEIYGYEALMRPMLKQLKNPTELLEIAKSQSKLSHIEKLTWFKSLECFSNTEVAKGACKIFINSISNQIMDTADIELIEQMYPQLLNRLVLELTEEERQEAVMTEQKREFLDKWGAELALDDFGEGYNNEALLLVIKPHLVKLDMSIIRNIHIDEGRLNMVWHLVQLCKARNVRIIAEGVEYKEEMEALIKLDIDYLQGYYLNKPSYNPQDISQDVRNEILEINQNKG